MFVTEKRIDPAKAIKHDTGRQIQTKFEGEPTYVCKLKYKHSFGESIYHYFKYVTHP
jgi:hypothetical protein